MAKSGVPVVSQIGSGLGAVGSAIGGFLSPKGPDMASPASTPNPSDPNTQAAMTAAEEEQAKKAKGQAANFLTSGGGAGLSSAPSTSRQVLLGS